MTKARTNAYGTTTLGSSTLTLGSATTSVTNLELVSPKELATISASAATGTINFDIVTQSVLYYTSNATANFTLNFRGSSSVKSFSLFD